MTQKKSAIAFAQRQSLKRGKRRGLSRHVPLVGFWVRIFLQGQLLWVESRGAITLRPSLLDLGVRFSPHPAPEYL